MNVEVNLTKDVLHALSQFKALNTLGLTATNETVKSDFASNLQRTILPPTLQKIKFKNVNTSVDYLLSLLHELEMLTEIYLYDGYTFKCWFLFLIIFGFVNNNSQSINATSFILNFLLTYLQLQMYAM